MRRPKGHILVRISKQKNAQRVSKGKIFRLKMPNSSSDQKHGLQCWGAGVPIVVEYRVLTQLQKKDKNPILMLGTILNKINTLIFCGEQSILSCLKPTFHFDSIFSYDIYTHLYSSAFDIKDSYSEKKILPTVWTCRLSEEFCFLKKAQNFFWFALTALKVVCFQAGGKSGLPTASPLFSTFNSSLLWPQERQQPPLEL